MPAAWAQGDLWIRQFEWFEGDYAGDVYADTSGVYVCGGRSHFILMMDRYVRKYDFDGNDLWTRELSAAEADVWRAIVVDTGRVYVVGEAEVFPGYVEALVLQYDKDGNEGWGEGFAIPGHIYNCANAVAVDTGGVYVVGWTDSLGLGQEDVFVRKYDLYGNDLWTLKFGTSQSDFGTGVCVNPSGVYVVGTTGGQLPGQTQQGGSDFFIRKYDRSGAEVWTHQFGTGSDDEVHDASCDAAGVYVVGATEGAFPTFTHQGGQFDSFVSKYDNNGVEVWIQQFGTAETDQVNDVFAGSTGVYLAGRTNAAFPSEIHGGLSDGYVRKHDLSGNALWTRHIGTTTGDEANGISVTGIHVYIAGWTNGVLPGQSSNGPPDSWLVKLEEGDDDGDGVFPSADLCPAENSSFFDRDGDGCIDDLIGARDIRYWAPEDLPVSYLVHSGGAPGINDGSDFTAIQSAMNTWAGVTGADFAVSYAGTTATAIAQALDGENLITFADTDIPWIPGGVVSLSYASHFTTPSVFKGKIYRPGQITDVDVLLNPLYTYQTSGAVWPVIDVEGAVAHAAGHVAGLDHSAIWASTLAFVYGGEEARALESDDELTLVKAYPTPLTLATANRLSGSVFDTDGSTPIPGAVVFAIDTATGDTLACEYTLPDGSYMFLGLPDGNYYVSVYPLNGSSKVGYLDNGGVYFDDVLEPAVTLFVPDSWTSTETNSDDPTLKDPVNVSGGSSVTGIDIIANEDLEGPEVVSITPEDGETGFLTISAIVVRFDEPIDAVSIPANFSLVDTFTSTFILGSAVLLDDDSTLVFVPSGPLANQTVYKVTVDTGLQDKFGNNLASQFVSHFTTEFSQPDGDGDGVPDIADLCPAENASYFDHDGDGCIDAWIGARQTSYWAPDDMPFEYWIHEDGAYGVTDGSDFTAVENGVNEWTTLPGVDFSVDYLGPTVQKDARFLDGINLVTFDDPDLLFLSGVIAVGLTTTFTEPTVFDGRVIRPGQIVDADLIYNKYKTFSTQSMGSGPDIESVAVHEAGHLFGFFHSAVLTSTMFYILPPRRDATSLSSEDSTMFFRGYPDPAEVAGANILTGTVRDSVTGQPVPGAIVYAINVSSGDTLGCEYTLPPEILPMPGMPQEGSFCFSGLPDGDYYVAIYPLNGTSPIKFLEAYSVSFLLDSTAVANFVPEYWDIDESASDDRMAMSPIAVVGGDSVHVELILNVDTTRPTVLSITPQDGEGNVRSDAAVIIAFSEPIEVSTVSISTFSLAPSLGGPSVGGLASFPKVKDDSLLAFTPFAALDYEITYRLTLETGITDKFGNGLADPFVSEFTIEERPAVSISSLMPSKGIIGSIVTISGLGFSSVAEEDTVLFSGVQAVVNDAQPNQLVVTVPAGIPTGALVSVKVGADVSTQLTFTVLPETEVARGIESGVLGLGSAPRSLTVTPDGNRAYVATGDGVTKIIVESGADFLDYEAVTIVGGVDELDVNPQGNRIYAVGRTDSALHVIDVSNPLSTIVLETLPVGAEPLGIVVDQRGDRAYVTTDASEIQIWDISRRRLPTQAHAEQIGTMASLDPNLRKKMAIDPVRNYLLALSGLGKVLVFDLNGDSLLTDVSVGADPQDIVVDPFAKRAYVSDATGTVMAVRLDLEPPSNDGDSYTSGSPRGMTITPAGRFIYATNRDLDLLQAIDLLAGSTAYRTVAATIPHRSRPVDVDLSPDGAYAYSIAEGQSQFVVTTIGLGPTLKSLSRIAGPVGTQLVLSGDGFGTDPLQTTVSFNGVTAVPDQIRETALTVTVPPGATSGDVTVERSTPTGPTVSNALPFEVLGPSSGALRLAAQLAPSGGPELEQILAMSPKGDLLVVAERGPQPDLDGKLHILDAAPGSATFNQFMDTGAVAPFDTNVADVAISPDGKKAFVVLTNRDTIPVIDVDRYSSTFGKRVGVITQGAFPLPAPSVFTISPDGQIGLVTGGIVTNVIDLFEGSATEYQAIDSVNTVSYVNAVAFHPSGTTAYFVGDNVSPAVRVVDLDSTSVDFGNLIAAVPIPGSPAEIPHSVSFTSDGDRCLVLTRETGAAANRSVVTLDTSDPRNPAFLDQQIFGTGIGFTIQEEIDVSPRGDRAIFHIQDVGFKHIDLTTTPYPTVETAFSSLNLTDWDIDYAPNASKFCGVSADNDSVYVFDFNDVQTLAIESGDLQTGVVNQPLALPLRVEVTDAGSNPIQGIPVTFEVKTGGGVLTATNAATQTVATDANGFAGVTLQLGSTVADSANSVEARAVGLIGSPVTFFAHAVLDPLTQPLSFLTITPADGASNVDILTAVQMTFNRGVDPASASSSKFFLHKSTEPATPVPAIIGFTDLNRKLSLSPIDPLEASTTYIVKATTDLRDESGGALDLAVAKIFTTEPPPPLSLASVAPPSATVSTTVVLAGTGFDPDLEDNTVLFKDKEAELLDGSTDFFQVVVPLDATTDSVRVTTPAGTSNALFFGVLVATTSSVDEVLDGINTTLATRGIAINPAGTWAYAISFDPPVVIPIDIAAKTSYPGIPVGTNPMAIDIHPNGKYAYVANFGSNSVTVINIDPADAQHFNTPDTTVIVGANPIDLVASPLGDRVYIANLGSSDISVLDVEEGSSTFNFVIDSGGVNKGARAVAMNPPGTRLYVGTDDGYVVLDPQQGFMVVSGTDKKQASKQVVMGPGGARLFVLTTEGDLVVYNIVPGSPNENQVTDSTRGRGGKTVAMNPPGTLLYLTLQNDQVLVFSVETPSNVSVIEDAGTEGISELTLIKELSLGSDLGPIVFDPTGSGLALVSSAGDELVLILNTSDVSVGPLEAAISVSPRTLNLQSRGRWVTGRIELTPSPPFHVQDIDIGTVLLNGTVPAEPDKWKIEDENQNDIDELVVKFDRALFQSMLPQGDSVEVTITATVGTRTFAGLDTIRTIRPTATFPKGGELLVAGSVVNVTWTSPAGYNPDAADVHWTPNDGRGWYPIAEGIPDAGSVEWLTPFIHHDSCRVMVTLYEGGSDLGMGMSQEMFVIQSPVAITLAGFTGTIKRGTPVVQWTTGLELNINGFHLLRAENDAGKYERLNSEVIPSKGRPSGADYGFSDGTARPNQDYFYKLQQVSESGENREFGPFKIVFRASFSLGQNFPNPFNPNTAIRFTIPKDSHVDLTIYDVAGRRVRQLINQKKQANFYKIVWDGTNRNGDRVASGVYFYRLVAGKFSMTKKMIMLK
jgi:DNA-binding beta-propeller fold protein YncE